MLRPGQKVTDDLIQARIAATDKRLYLKRIVYTSLLRKERQNRFCSSNIASKYHKLRLTSRCGLPGVVVTLPA
jgi:hypothetical protein